MLYTLVLIVSLHWGDVPKSSHFITHNGLTFSECQTESRNWNKWQSDLKQKMGKSGDVAIYPSCVPQGVADIWWLY
jgi:hypothetical protein